MTKPKKKDSLVWLNELVESSKKWRASLDPSDTRELGEHEEDTAHGRNLRALATAVDGYQKAIKDEVEAEERVLELEHE